MKDRDKIIILLSTIGSLICLNILAVRHFGRVDLTRDQVYTLSEASQNTMRDLEDPVTITAYFTEELPPPFAGNARFVRDLLEEYRVHSKGLLSYAFIDPEQQETDEDKEKKKEVKRDIFGRSMREQTSVEQELASLGVQPVEIRVIEEDQAQTKRGYMGLVVRYQESTEVIPVVQDTADLEYQLTTLIRNLSRARVPVVGIVQGHGEPTLEEGLAQLSRLLSQVYEVKAVNLNDEVTGETPKDLASEYDALLVVGPTQNFADAEMRALDQFLMKGKSVAFFLDQVTVDLKTFETTPVSTNLGEMLKSYGVEVGSQLVADVDCASLSVTRRLGNMMVQMPLRYPFVPQLKKMEGDGPLTRGISEVTLPFATPVYLSDALKSVPAEGETKEAAGEVLARSSKNSWLEDPNPVSLSPQRFLERVEASFTGPYDVLVNVKGMLPSHFASEATAVQAEGGVLAKSTEEARLLVAGTSGIVTDAYLSQMNAALALNMVDWMLLDPALFSMRTRGLIDPPVDPELSDTGRNLVKYGNVVGVPLAAALLGLLLWRLRQARRKRLMAIP